MNERNFSNWIRLKNLSSSLLLLLFIINSVKPNNFLLSEILKLILTHLLTHSLLVLFITLSLSLSEIRVSLSLKSSRSESFEPLSELYSVFFLSSAFAAEELIDSISHAWKNVWNLVKILSLNNVCFWFCERF